jgi:hypothetical protein
MSYKQKSLAKYARLFCFNQYNTKNIAAKQQEKGAGILRLCRKDKNRFYTVFVRFGLICH